MNQSTLEGKRVDRVGWLPLDFDREIVSPPILGREGTGSLGIVRDEPVANGPGEGFAGRSRWVTWARRLRVASGIALLLVLSYRGPCRHAMALFTGSFPKGPFGLVEARYRRLVGTLPPRGVFGFRTVGPLKVGKNHELEGDSESIARYVFAQYLLAPRVLDLGPSRGPVIRDDLEPVRVSPGEGY